jgi:hypothetical protein
MCKHRKAAYLPAKAVSVPLQINVHQDKLIIILVTFIVVPVLFFGRMVFPMQKSLMSVRMAQLNNIRPEKGEDRAFRRKKGGYPWAGVTS